MTLHPSPPVGRERRRRRWAWGILIAVAGTGLLLVAVGATLLFGIDDARRGRLAAAVLQRLLPGQFRIAALHVAPDLALTLRGIAIDGPDGTPVARAQRLTARPALAALRGGVLRFEAVRVELPHIEVVARGEGPLPIQGAFQPPIPEPPPGTPAPTPVTGGLRVEFADIVVSQASVRVRVPPLELGGSEIDVAHASLWLQGESLGLDVGLLGQVRLAVPPVRLAASTLQLEGRGLRHQFTRDVKELDIAALHVEVPGLGVDVRGSLAATDHAVTAFDGRLEVALDTAMAALRALLPRDVVSGLRGRLALVSDVSYEDGTYRLDGQAAGERLAWRHIGLQRVRARGALTGHRLALEALSLESPGGRLEVGGAATLLPSHGVLASQHDIYVNCRELRLRTLLAPFTPAPGLLPEAVSFKVHSRGRGLWPMTAEADLDLTARGMPKLPLLPDPFEVHGKLLTHPDAIEIFRLRLGGGDSHITLQGIVPLQPQGVLEIYQKLHVLP